MIHRPTNIQGRGAEDTNIMANIVGYSVVTSAVPKVQDLGGHAQFITLDQVSSGILATVRVTPTKSCGEFGEVRKSLW